MAENQNAEARDRKGTMRMDEAGLTAFTRPRPLVESRPFPVDERGRLVAMASDVDPDRPARKQPFALEEQKPK